MAKAQVLFAALAATALSSAAFAADLPSRRVAPAYVAPVPMFTWTGFYVGGNIGYGFGGSVTETGALIGLPPLTPNHWAVWSGGGSNMKGLLGGGQIGYNAQVSPWFVVGVEADIQGADLRSNGTTVGAMPLENNGRVQYTLVNSAKRVDWFGTVRARLGVTMPSVPNLLLYGTGGLAYGHVKTNVVATFVNPSAASTMTGWGAKSGEKFGWTLGAGVEWAPMAMPAVSLKLEYLFTNLGSTSTPLSGGVANGIYYACCTAMAGVTNSTTRFHTVRAGLNYRFGAATAPVVAKY